MFEKGEDKYLEADGGKRRGHAAVERGGALASDDAAEEADSGGGSSDEGGGVRGSGRRRLLQADAERVERVARDDPGHAADATGNELPPPAARQELRPELHDLLSHYHAHLPLALKNTTLHAQRGESIRKPTEEAALGAQSLTCTRRRAEMAPNEEEGGGDARSEGAAQVPPALALRSNRMREDGAEGAVHQ